MFRKVLVANRGEIAVRAFRAATELGAQTVAVFPHEDRKSEHRLKADEAYEIGEPGHPVRAYLDPRRSPGSPSRPARTRSTPATASSRRTRPWPRPARAAGITFVGPPADVLNLTGNKARAIAAAREAGLPTLRGSEPSDDVDTCWPPRPTIGFPIFVKAVAGGGGRGMRRVERRGGPARVARGRDARGGGGVRRRHGLPGGGGGQPPPHRGADPGRRRPATSSTCSSATARCSGGTRRSSRSPRRPNLDPDAARADVRPRRRVRPRDRLRQRRARSSSCSPPTAATSSSR